MNHSLDMRHDLLETAARFAASPAPLEVITRGDVANVSEMETFQVGHLPHDHRISITLSGRLPVSLVRHDGSFLEGILALQRDPHTMSWSMLCGLLLLLLLL